MRAGLRAQRVALRLVAVLGIAVFACWPFVTPMFGIDQTLYLDAGISAAILTILAISLNLAMGYAGLLSFIHTGLLAIGGYMSAIFMIKLGWNPWLTLPLAVAATTVVAIFVTLISARATNVYWGLITLSFDLVIIQIAQQWTSVTGGFNGLVAVPRPSLGGGMMMTDAQFFYVAFASLVAVYVWARNIVRSDSGRAFRAVRQSEDTGASLGMSPTQTRLLAFAVSGAMAGLAGALYAQYFSFISPDVAGQGQSLTLFIAVFLGGFGTLVGPILGMVVVTVVGLMIRGLGDNSQLVLGLFLLAAILVIPRGIVGTWTASRFHTAARRKGQAAGGAATAAGDAKSDAGHLRDLLASGPEAPAAEAADGAVLLRASGVGKSFGGVVALSGVEIELRRGEVHGLIGPNGAGKSTFASCLSGQLKPDAGQITIAGAPLPRAAHQVARRGITRVFQVPHLFDGESVVDNVLSGMHLRVRASWLAATFRLPSFRREESRLRREAVELLQAVRLADLAEEPASVLSHGQKRLVEIVRAIAAQPSVLILDEPATGLTRAELTQLERMIALLRDARLAILLIEHNMEFVMRLCDQLTVLNFGEVIAHGTPTSVSTSAVVREAYLGGAA